MWFQWSLERVWFAPQENSQEKRNFLKGSPETYLFFLEQKFPKFLTEWKAPQALKSLGLVLMDQWIAEVFGLRKYSKTLCVTAVW